MCGICGVFRFSGAAPLPVEHVRRATAFLAPRGPDDERFHETSQAFLGFRRLAIIDIQNGSQPFIDPATGAALVFNGEIFNFMELRKELESKGCVFRTRSDTEVLLQAYLEWGRACLGKIRGMFAFAIVEPAKNSVFLARDPMGVKPLYYAVLNGQLVFASSVAAILKFPEVSRDLDPASVSHYLTTIRSSMGERTLFKQIKTLLPGHLMTAGGGRPPAISRYWEFPIIPADEKRQMSVEAASGEAMALFESSVREQLVSDVPLGGFLSGGLDSTAIACLASRLTAGNYHAYSVGYEADAYNEWEFAEEAAKAYGMRCERIVLRPEDFERDWRALVGFKGLPLSTPNEVGILNLAKALRREYTVALSGEGADELFGGYSIPYFSAYDFDRARRARPAFGEPLTEADALISRLFGRPWLTCRGEHFFLLNSWIPLRDKFSLLTPAFLASAGQDEAMFESYDNLFHRLEDCSTFDAYMHVHARVNLEGLLNRMDSSTMSASVEARVPFTDHRLAELLFSLPDNLKTDWVSDDARKQGATLNVTEIDAKNLLTTKVVLRKAFASLVPPRITERRKMSFPVPFREWFANGMRSFVLDTIRGSPLVDTVFARQSVETLCSTLGDPGSNSAMEMWPILNLCLWHDICVKNN